MRGPTRSSPPTALTWSIGGTLSCASWAIATQLPPPCRRQRRSPGSNRDGAADWVISQLGAKRSAWNAADIRGKVEVLLAQTNLVAEPAARIELAEDVTARAADRCVRLLASPDVPEHVRSLTSRHVVKVESDLVGRLTRRAEQPARRIRLQGRGLTRIDPTQAVVVRMLAGSLDPTCRASTGLARHLLLKFLRTLCGLERVTPL